MLLYPDASTSDINLSDEDISGAESGFDVSEEMNKIEEFEQ